MGQPQSRARRRRAGRGFTLVELLVVIAVIAILASLVMTAAFRGMDMGRQTQCRSNLSQVGKAFWIYVHHYDQWMPAIGYPVSRAANGHYKWWYDALSDEMGGQPKIVVCPAKPQTKLGYGGSSYPWTINEAKGIKYEYGTHDYPVAKALCDTYTVVHGIHAPNGVDLMKKFVEAFQKVFADLDQALDHADDEIYPGPDGKLYGAG